MNFVIQFVGKLAVFAGKFFCELGIAQVLRVKVPSRVFTTKCSEPQDEDSNV